MELDGKTLNSFFKKYRSIQNKALINYKGLKDELNNIIIENGRRQSISKSPMREVE